MITEASGHLGLLHCTLLRSIASLFTRLFSLEKSPSRYCPRTWRLGRRGKRMAAVRHDATRLGTIEHVQASCWPRDKVLR
jgi:hypothetical protein